MQDLFYNILFYLNLCNKEGMFTIEYWYTLREKSHNRKKNKELFERSKILFLSFYYNNPQFRSIACITYSCFRIYVCIYIL